MALTTSSLSRRSLVAGAAVAGLCSGKALAAGAASRPIASIPKAWADLWSAHDVAGLLGLYAEGAVHEDNGIEHTNTGRPQIRQFVERTLMLFPDVKVALLNSVTSADTAMEEWEMSGTFLAGEAFGQPANGKAFRFRGGSLMRFERGLIAQQRDYWNRTIFQRQITA